MCKFISVLTVVALCSPLFAAEPQQGAPVEEKKASPAPEAGEEKPKHLLSLEGSIDFTHEYIYRGYKQHSGGVIMQPSLTLSLNLPELQKEDFSITPYVGTWNSTSTVTNSPHDPGWFFETDTFVGTRLESGNWSLDLYYQYSAYPGGVWTSTHEVDAVVSYDDAWFTKEKLNWPVAINPHVAIAQELNRSDNLERGPTGTYVELGVAPAIDVPLLGTTVTLSVPTNVGFSAANYYVDNGGANRCFGYVSTGLKAELPLEFLSGKGFGDWKLVGTVTYTRMNAESAIDANEGKRDGIVGAASVQFSY
jgi:hypothetical protein